METCRHGQRTGDRIGGRGQDRGWRSDMETCRLGDFRIGQIEDSQTEDGGQTWRYVDMDGGQGTGQRIGDWAEDGG